MAERSKFIVMMREEEMKAAVLRAEGESEAARLVADIKVWTWFDSHEKN